MFTKKIKTKEKGNGVLCEHSCDECKKLFWLPRYRHNYKSKVQSKTFCSKKCTDKNKKKAIGILSPIWKGKTKTTQGYIRISVPNGTPGSYTNKKCANWTQMFEHRYVMQQHLDRPLLRTESVHHKNGIKNDNRIENLELRCGNHGTGSTSYTEDVNLLLEKNARLLDRLAKVSNLDHALSVVRKFANV